MHLCAVAAPPESILRLRVEFVWSIFPNSWRILSPPSQRESTLQRSNCVSLHFMVKRIPGKNGQKRLIKLHLLHLTIEFPIFPIFKSKCIFKGLESEAKRGFQLLKWKCLWRKECLFWLLLLKAGDDNSFFDYTAVYDCFTRLLRAWVVLWKFLQLLF